MTPEGLQVLRSKEAQAEGALATVTIRLERHCAAMHQLIDNLPATPEAASEWHHLQPLDWDQRFHFIELLVDQVQFHQTALTDAVRILERQLPEGEAKMRATSRLASDERRHKHNHVDALLMSATSASGQE